MLEAPPHTLADLLRQHRRAAKLSQQELAERSGLSIDAISMLERGLRRRPRRDTLRLLATALHLSEIDARALLIARAQSSPPSPAPADGGNPLPDRVAPLVGRSHELKRACTKLRRSHPRLITLAGPPGVGKTRLALAVVELMRDELQFAARVNLVPIGDHRLLVSAMSQAIGAPESGPGPDGLATYIGEGFGLLLLDNFEHLLPAANVLAELLDRCSQLRILVTSRSPLRLRYEHVLQVQPLSLRHATTVFVQRARERTPAVTLNASTRATFRKICSVLDCLPLALELAAPWLRLFEPDALLKRLTSRLEMLVDGPVDLPHRQRTMRTALEWSYRLLEPDEQAMFRWMSVFSGGADLEAIEAVSDSLGCRDPLLIVARLIDRSLLATARVDGKQRIKMLQTLREYGQQLLTESQEDNDVRRAHVKHYAWLAATAEPELTRPGQEAWRARLEREQDNMRRALEWAREHNEVQLGLRMAGMLARFWERQGQVQEGYAWLEQFLSADKQTESETGALAARGAARLACRLFDYASANHYGEASLAIYEDRGDTDGIDSMLNNLALFAWYEGDMDRALRFWEADLILLRHVHNVVDAAPAKTMSAGRGTEERAVHVLAEIAQIRRALGAGQEHSLARTLNVLGSLGRSTKQLDHALSCLQEALELYRHLGSPGGFVAVESQLSDLARDRGDGTSAISGYQQNLRTVMRLRDVSGASYCIEGLAACASMLGQMERAARLFGGAAALRKAFGAAPMRPHRAERDEGIARVRSSMGSAAFVEAWSAGESLSLDEAVTEALLESPARSGY